MGSQIEATWKERPPHLQGGARLEIILVASNLKIITRFHAT